DHVVVKEIVRASSEVIEIKGPAAQRNGQARFMLFIPLATQRQEADALADGQVEERSGDGVDGRSLVEAAVSSTDNPFQPGDLDRYPQARAAHVFLQETGKVSKPDAAIHRQPG